MNLTVTIVEMGYGNFNSVAFLYQEYPLQLEPSL